MDLEGTEAGDHTSGVKGGATAKGGEGWPAQVEARDKVLAFEV